MDIWLRASLSHPHGCRVIHPAHLGPRRRPIVGVQDGGLGFVLAEPSQLVVTRLASPPRVPAVIPFPSIAVAAAGLAVGVGAVRGWSAVRAYTRFERPLPRTTPVSWSQRRFSAASTRWSSRRAPRWSRGRQYRPASYSSRSPSAASPPGRWSERFGNESEPSESASSRAVVCWNTPNRRSPQWSAGWPSRPTCRSSPSGSSAPSDRVDDRRRRRRRSADVFGTDRCAPGGGARLPDWRRPSSDGRSPRAGAGGRRVDLEEPTDSEDRF